MQYPASENILTHLTVPDLRLEQQERAQQLARARPPRRKVRVRERHFLPERVPRRLLERSVLRPRDHVMQMVKRALDILLRQRQPRVEMLDLLC